ncbi:DinB family protein [Streptomyces piniterrae]|uniref:DinB family protein n=1 Tax=Streptomyces piniterrae TaxID=2571125 RepID=A0A4U0NSK2_9ACTN|nr:DinB family protein [Streptomyces piniterrae]
MNKQTVHDELERARADFHALIGGLGEADWAGQTRETRWNNEQLLFHMLFGYMVVRALLTVVRIFGRLPRGVSRAYARLLDAAVKPFDEINYVGSCMAAKVFNRRRMGTKFDRVIASLHCRLDAESEADLARGMHYPVRWDPFFKDFMTLADIYRYPTQHFDFHRRQLTLDAAGRGR